MDALNFIKRQSLAVKGYIISLVVVENLLYIPWRWRMKCNAKEMCTYSVIWKSLSKITIFLILLLTLRKIIISLNVIIKLQGKIPFPWVFFLIAKEN
jgi:hypothetical protein